MDYRVFDLESRAPLDTLELHVLARAYRAAWQAVHGTLPEGPHPLPMLRSVVEYGSSSDQRGSTPARVPQLQPRKLRTDDNAVSRTYSKLTWSDPHGVLTCGATVFLYFIRVVDDNGFEFRYIGKSKNGELRLKEYQRNIAKIFEGKPRRTTAGQERYRAVHLALAKACERGWSYQFFPYEEVPLKQIDRFEQQRASELGCNLNGARSWLVQNYETVDLQSLV